MEEERKIIVLTGPSGSGKTTLEIMAINNGYKQVVSFTTRKPRNDEELDTYVFLTRKQFARKMFNGDFMETEVFNGEAYALGPIPKEGNVIMSVTPSGREQVKKWATLNGEQVMSVFLSIGEEETLRRLKRRGEKEVEARMRDGEWMTPSGNCLVLNAEATTRSLFTLIDTHG